MEDGLQSVARNTMAWLAVVSLAVAPVAAQESRSEVSRHSAPAGAASNLRGNSTLFFLGAIVAVALGIFLLIDDNDPASP